MMFMIAKTMILLKDYTMVLQSGNQEGMVYIYVTDLLNKRVKKFTHNGQFIIEFGCDVPEDIDLSQW